MHSILAIVVITYLIGLAAKQIPKIKDELIPVIVGVAGGILGVVGMQAIPDFPANDVLNAIAVGIVSGLGKGKFNALQEALNGKDAEITNANIFLIFMEI